MWKAIAKTETKGVVVEADYEDTEPGEAAKYSVESLENKLVAGGFPSIVENMEVKLEWLP